MAILVQQRSTGAHWYTRDGKPAHEMPRKDGTGTRQTTLADARKLHLLPSVTNILGMLAKPALDAWRQDRTIDAVLATVRTPDESDQYWRERVKAEAERTTSEAADTGAAIHAALDGSGPCPDGYAESVARARAVADEMCAGMDITREAVVVCAEYGYAGRCDVYAVDRMARRGVVIDYKTRKSEVGKPMRTYETEPMQLAAYADAVMPCDSADWQLVNVLISTSEPGRVDVVRHEAADVMDHVEAFRACATLWQHIKGYRP